MNAPPSPLRGKTILITGAARRIGRALALATARAGGDVVIHHGHSPREAEALKNEIEALGQRAAILQADLSDPSQVEALIPQASEIAPLYGLVNNAAIFEELDLAATDLPAWERHLRINLTAPFLLSRAFATALPEGNEGRILNRLDWRALRPGADHLPYTISKAGLAALTRSLAIALAPRIAVNGIALGAILPPSDGGANADILHNVPAERWGRLEEVEEAAIFLLCGPAYITGEIIHVDGGRHLI